MGDSGFPNQHTTTTTVTTNTTVQTDVRFDPTYLRTLPGIVKCVQFLLNMLGFICIEVSAFSYYSRGSFFIFVSMTAFWFTGFLLVFYIFHIVEKFFKIPWLKIEFVFCGVWVLLYLIASCLAATFGIEAFTVAAFFGFCAMVVYGFDVYLKYRAIQSGQLAQGERVINKETTTTRSPTY